MAPTPMDIDSPTATVPRTKPTVGSLPPAKVGDVIANFRPTKHYVRESHGSPTTIVSLDFDDRGEILMTSESDESIQLYNMRHGTHQKTLLSKKYGVKLAKFSHSSTSVIYASTKENHALRYLSTLDNTFIRYFRGHDAPVTCIAPNPGADTFLTCSEDNTVRVWDANSENCCGKLQLASAYLAAFDPSATVIAIASEAAQTVLLYDFRQWDKEPFATFDILPYTTEAADNGMECRGWNKLEFSNDSKNLLIGTSGAGHFLLDAFDGRLKTLLRRPRGGPARLVAGEHNDDPLTADNPKPKKESSGDIGITPDGRFVVSGQSGKNVLVWDTLPANLDPKITAPVHELECKTEVGVLAINPRFNIWATGDRELDFWVPDVNL